MQARCFHKGAVDYSLRGQWADEYEKGELCDMCDGPLYGDKRGTSVWEDVYWSVSDISFDGGSFYVQVTMTGGMQRTRKKETCLIVQKQGRVLLTREPTAVSVVVMLRGSLDVFQSA